MGKIIAELHDNKVFVTRYESPSGFIIPDKLSQEKSIIRENIDQEEVVEEVSTDDKLAVPRQEFIEMLLKLNKNCQEAYKIYGKGLYSYKDLAKGITWAEVAYLLYYIGGIKRTVDWGDIKPQKEDRVCVLNEIVNNQKNLDEKLADYKNRLDMANYIKAIIKRDRYIPLPMYCAFSDLLLNDSINIALQKEDMFKKISKADFKMLSNYLG